jgi:hypothetical protein
MGRSVRMDARNQALPRIFPTRGFTLVQDSTEVDLITKGRARTKKIVGRPILLFSPAAHHAVGKLSPDGATSPFSLSARHQPTTARDV